MMRGRQQGTPLAFAGPQGILLGSWVNPESLRLVFCPGLLDAGLQEEFYWIQRKEVGIPC